MAILKGILRHGFLLLVLVGVGFAYYYRAELFPNLFKQEQAAADTAAQQVAEAPAGDQPQAPPANDQASGTGDRPAADLEFGAPPPVSVAQAPPIAEPEIPAAVEPPPETAEPAVEPPPLPAETDTAPTAPAAERAEETAPEPVAVAQGGGSVQPARQAEVASAAEQTMTSQSTAAGQDTGPASQVAAPATSESATAQAEEAEEAAGGPAAEAAAPRQPFALPEPESYPEEAAQALVKGQAEAMWGPGEGSAAEYRYRPDTPTKKQEPEEPPPGPAELLSAARQAFWAQDYEGAEQNYKALLELDAKNADHFGELGNLYFSNGQWAKAAEAYGSAVELLLAEGRYDRAAYLIRIVQGLDPERAQALQAQLDAARNPGGKPQGSPEPPA